MDHRNSVTVNGDCTIHVVTGEGQICVGAWTGHDHIERGPLTWDRYYCDFPGGDAHQLYRSIRRLLDLPGDTRLYMCHDYPPAGREAAWQTTVAEQRRAKGMTDRVMPVRRLHVRQPVFDLHRGPEMIDGSAELPTARVDLPEQRVRQKDPREDDKDRLSPPGPRIVDHCCGW